MAHQYCSHYFLPLTKEQLPLFFPDISNENETISTRSHSFPICISIFNIFNNYFVRFKQLLLKIEYFL